MPWQVSQNYRTGKLALSEVGLPALRSGGIIVRSEYSVISPGTEGTKVREARLSLVNKARARPDQVKQVLNTVRQQGLRAAYQKVVNRLEQLTPLGYSIAGRVVAVGEGVSEFSVGDRVAAGGAGYANHAEYNFIPRNLAVRVPDVVKTEQAAFTTIGSIALHAYRQSDIKLGERALVIGLGLVGQLITQILVASGVTVIGIDLDPERCTLAVQSGAVAASAPDAPQWRGALGAQGADAVFVAAGGSSNALIELAADAVRDRGRIVVVGKTSLDLDYNVFFRKEAEVRFSRSYGPGRFDPKYEEGGEDYPLPYVRWTERRNMAAFLDLLAQSRLNIEPLISAVRPFDAAVAAFEDIYENQINALGVIFNYGEEKPEPRRVIRGGVAHPAIAGNAVARIGVIGAGNYCASVILPALRKDQRVELAHVVTNTGLSAKSIAERFGIPDHGTDVNAILADQSIAGVIIATRHASHAGLVARALTASKAVFVEKPLAIDQSGLDLVTEAMRPGSRLMTGFNRRYSPAVQRIAALTRGTGPLQILYRVQAGRLPSDAWQSSSHEGGRFAGEAGHFLDVFQFLIGARARHLQAARVHAPGLAADDGNVNCTIAYHDGSTATLLYSTLGGQRTPKEYMEVHGGGQSLILHNFDTLEIITGDQPPRHEKRLGGDKGQIPQMKAFIDAVTSGKDMPVAFEDLAETTRLTCLAAQASLDFQSVPIG